MSTVSQNDVLEFCRQQGWEVVNIFDEPDVKNPSWSVTAVTEDGIRVTVDEPMEEPRLNNIFIEKQITDAASLEVYRQLIEEAPDSITVDIESEDGLFMRAKHSPDVDLEDEGIVERLVEKDVAWSIRVTSVGCTQETTFGDVRSWVESVRTLTKGV